MSPRTKELSVAELESMLENRKSELAELEEHRSALQHELEDVESRIGHLAGKSGRGGRRRGRRKSAKRAKNAKTLHAVVCELLGRSKDGYSLSALTEKVLATGYKSNASDFKNVLYQCLYNSDDIKHDAKSGNYRLKRTTRPARK